ncbi:hypothetical protein QBC34DRAFT_406668 [Podospora aff. communis PSN243]|uniref:Uncharacterized protein n=1 Tax=Podospora aff. communis PSN243 TaxID=3040156 RepID=A0AAV9GJQ1_9PEZI|nr:hypothetical protein QBC34DRAFT_406668 [Podospora aff. communis PSN243]
MSSAPTPRDQSSDGKPEDERVPDQKQTQDNTKDDTNDDETTEYYRPHVDNYDNAKDFPFEIGETVWVFKAGYRALLGPFRIVRAHAANRFELVTLPGGVVYPELVDGGDLRRE